MSNKPRLISHHLCPFVQRAIITLRAKDIDFDIDYIDLANKPDWFHDLSPLGKVPVLQVGDQALFESMVINEYLDEITPPHLQLNDPVGRAQNRAWCEFASSLLMTQYQLCQARNQDDYQTALSTLKSQLDQLEPVIEGPYFNGEIFALVDTAFAPFFIRNEILGQFEPQLQFNHDSNLGTWQAQLLALPTVMGSCIEDFDSLFIQKLNEHHAYISAHKVLVC